MLETFSEDGLRKIVQNNSFHRRFSNIYDLNVLREIHLNLASRSIKEGDKSSNTNSSFVQEEQKDMATYVPQRNPIPIEVQNEDPLSKSMTTPNDKKTPRKFERDYNNSEWIDETLKTYKLKYRKIEQVKNKYYSFNDRSLKISDELDTDTLKNDSDYVE